MAEITLEFLAKQQAAILTELATVRAYVNGIPLIGNAIETLRHDVRLMRAAINDFGRTNITAGEIEAMHTDIDRVQSKQDDLERRIVTLEQKES